MGEYGGPVKVGVLVSGQYLWEPQLPRSLLSQGRAQHLATPALELDRMQTLEQGRGGHRHESSLGHPLCQYGPPRLQVTAFTDE